MIHLPCRNQAQIRDDFSYKYLSQGNWQGDTTEFLIINGQLRSNSGIVNDTISIWRPLDMAEEWSLEINLKVNTSSANYMEWTIITSDSPMHGSVILKVGGSDDELQLYRIINEEKTLLIDGKNKVTEKAQFTIKVLYQNSKWSLYRIYPDSIVYEGSTGDTALYSSGLTAISIRQSSASFHYSHFFDHLYIGPEQRDTLGPVIDSVNAGFNFIQLIFDEEIRIDSMDEQLLISGPTNLRSIELAKNQLIIHYDSLFNGKYLFNPSHILDTAGNRGTSDLININVLLGSAPSSEALIFNEILFNPLHDGVDYLELYNKSGQILNLEGLRIYRVVEEEIRDEVILPHVLLFPRSFLIISEDTHAVQSQYPVHAGTFLQWELPPMNNDDGILVIRDTSGSRIDSLTYNSKMHFPYLRSEEGVSLERISYSGASYDTTMWHSAASSSGFGTPGMENSQYIRFTDNGIQLIDQFLSPDADGNGDVLAISYQFSKPGYLIHAGIYDLNGVLLERPFHITAAGTTGILSWNLVQTNGTILQTGSYIILIEAVHPSGAMMRKKLAFMVL